MDEPKQAPFLKNFMMRKIGIVIITVIAVIVIGIISIILQGAVYESKGCEIQNLTTKFKTTIYMGGNYSDANITIGNFPPVTSKLNLKSSRYVYEIKVLRNLKLENINMIIEEFFREKPKFILEITAGDEIYNFTFKDGEETFYSKTITKEGKILNETVCCPICCQLSSASNDGECMDYDEKPNMFRLPQDGPSIYPYRDWMLFLDENFSWKIEIINDMEYDDGYANKEGSYVFRKTETVYDVEGIERINGRDCFKVIVSQYQELELILPENKEEPQYSIPSPEQQPLINISSTHHSIMWVDKNERILVKTIDYYPSFLSYEQTLK